MLVQLTDRDALATGIKYPAQEVVAPNPDAGIGDLHGVRRVPVVLDGYLDNNCLWFVTAFLWGAGRNRVIDQFSEGMLEIHVLAGQAFVVPIRIEDSCEFLFRHLLPGIVTLR